MNNRAIVKIYKEQLIRETSISCDQYLDHEYKNLCIHLIEKMGRKRIVPFLSGEKLPIQLF